MTLPPSSPSPEPLPPPPASAIERLGAPAIARLTAYGELLATDGVTRRLIGPREVPRLWDRHLLNCAAMAEAVPTGARVVDVGTGAGLPGVVLALVREDLSIVLIEPLQRRCDFLLEAIDQLRLGERVAVRRGRAEQVAPVGADIVTSRAVAALDQLAAWCLPHAKVGGVLLAMKGQRAGEELAAAQPVLRRWGADTDASVVLAGAGWVEPPVQLVRATRR
ncbi:MAG TPA: 16S rRNA (guanine(527)-N(7))-methyltransferase RsmG, partial [Candidatus Synoicihabitans sp.]|nr:16S rRNA (guanine(527)-N(7))-methyltransferase RsmG [Candidatus Synoicihabitans sp.]